jgi:hypothetical protein
MLCKKFLRGIEWLCVITLGAQQARQGLEDARIVIDKKNCKHGARCVRAAEPLVADGSTSRLKINARSHESTGQIPDAARRP